MELLMYSVFRSQETWGVGVLGVGYVPLAGVPKLSSIKASLGSTGGARLGFGLSSIYAYYEPPKRVRY